MGESLFPRVFDSGRELLKWIAIITMTFDHVGAILYPDIEVLRFIGRLSFPLFAYLLVLGIEDTANIRNYFFRLFVFALISQVPFVLALEYTSFESFNIFFTLSAGLAFIHFFKKNSLYALIPVFVCLALPFDYGIYGLAIIGCMYMLRASTKVGVVSLVLINTLFLLPFSIQFFSIIAIPFVVLHKHGSLNITKEMPEKLSIPLWRKYLFYVYYPLHFILLYLVSLIYF